MITIEKLFSLPRSLRLRKAASIFEAAERRHAAVGRLSTEEAEYLGAIAAALALESADSAGSGNNKAKNFPPAAAHAFSAAAAVFRAAPTASNADRKKEGANEKEEGEVRRCLNTVHHLLRAQTGRCAADWDFVESSLGRSLDASKRRPFAGMHVYLEDIRSPFNVGALFRAAESFGVEKIWLSPLAADPRHPRSSRTAMGCVDILPWQRLEREPFGPDFDGTAAFPAPFFALETGGTFLQGFTFPLSGTLIVGSEELGVSPEALLAAGASLGRVSIPLRGAKASLNVSVAFGIVINAWAAALEGQTLRTPAVL